MTLTTLQPLHNKPLSVTLILNMTLSIPLKPSPNFRARPPLRGLRRSGGLGCDGGSAGARRLQKDGAYYELWSIPPRDSITVSLS